METFTLDSLRSLGPAKAAELWNKVIPTLSKAEAIALNYDWNFWAPEHQKAPGGDWQTWLFLGGRGAGKTRAGAEWVRLQVELGRAGRLALVAPTAADGRDVIIEGDSGILRTCAPWLRPKYEPSKRRLTWPNGATALLFSADEPERLRGPQFDAAWCDELAAWRFPEAWDLLQFGLRLGTDPRCVVTTTPKPSKLIRDLMAQSNTVITRATTFANRANLAPAFFERIIKRYEGTRMGRQEINAELLADAEGALWNRDLIEATRVFKTPEMKRIVVAIDPAISSGEDSNETGIIAGGIGKDGHGYILDDRTVKAAPAVWAAEAVKAYVFHKADRIIAEANQGGEMIKTTIATIDPRLPVKLVHASRGKQTRAEPISALYEQRKVHHYGAFPELEDQLCMWQPGDASPDRLDALVWCLSELMIAPGPSRNIVGI